MSIPEGDLAMGGRSTTKKLRAPELYNTPTRVKRLVSLVGTPSGLVYLQKY